MPINIAKTLASAFGKAGKPLGVRSLTLTQSTPGTRNPGAVAQGTNPTVASYSATGLVTAFGTATLPDTQIQVQTRTVLIFGATLPSGVTPRPGDRIAIANAAGVTETLTVDQEEGSVTADPVQAAWICRTTA
ncbi:MAG TPA: hypothetical protein VFQ42_22390 [Mycobacterium sp.]|nr:hypothetical protein [Mycobacterium sp.]